MSFPCPKCTEAARIYSSRRNSEQLIQYIHCKYCQSKFKVYSEVKKVIAVKERNKKPLAKSIPFKNLKAGDIFKTSPSCRVFWIVLSVDKPLIPLRTKAQTKKIKILVESLNSSKLKVFSGSDIRVYLEPNPQALLATIRGTKCK